jgi:hypothetical protein
VAEGHLYTELAALRKGWGLRRPKVRDRLGPELRKLCGVDDSTTHSAARDKITSLLTRALGVLPDEVALAARVMMAMEPDYTDQTLTRRQERLANAWNVDPVTVRRRCDAALEQVSTHLAEHGWELAGDIVDDVDAFNVNDWYTVSCSTILRLDKATPEATEIRQIVSLKEGLAKVAIGFALPRPRSETRARMGMDVEMEFGGELEANRQPSAEYFVQYIRFPHPLASGEEHTFGRTVRVPPGQLMASHYVVFPRHRVDHFELRVKFDQRRLPKIVWRVSAIPYHVSEADGPTRDLLEVDSVGEVTTVFTRLKPSFGYGLCWLP